MFSIRKKLIISLVLFAAIIVSALSINAADINAPSAAFEISNITPALNEIVSFDASESIDAQGTIASYEWNFGDGKIASGITVNHSFTKTDDFKVTLTVKDASGNINTKSKIVFVGRPEGWTEKTHSKNADLDYKLLFPDDKVLRIDITMSTENFEKVQTDFFKRESGTDPVYVPVNVQYNGNTWWNVGFRYKGNSSLSAAKVKNKAPFRLNFDKFEDTYPEISNQHFYGFSCMTFGNNFGDYSFMRSRIAAEIFSECGVISARTSFCRVYIDTGNGPKYWGLYSMTEDISDGAVLKDRFGDDKGNCYKPEGAGADWSYPFNQTGFIKQNNEKAGDFSDVTAAHAALFASNTDASQWRANLEKYFNVRMFLRWLAINTAMVNWDSYGDMAQNYYLYQDLSKGGELVWIPWDLNEALNIEKTPASLSLSELYSKWPLIGKLLSDPVYKNIYHYEMQQAINGCLNPDKITAKVLSYKALIKPYVVGPEGERSGSTSLTGGETAFNSSCDAIITHINSRQAAVNDYLKSITITPVETTTPPSTAILKPTPTSVTVLKGDLNNDSQVNSVDFALLRSHLLGINSLTGNALLAADLDSNDSINSIDFMKLRLYLLGMASL